MGPLRISDLSEEEISKICEEAEEEARRFVFSRVGRKMLSELNIVIEAEGNDELSLSVSVEFEASSLASGLDVNSVAEEACRVAAKAFKRCLRERGWR